MKFEDLLSSLDVPQFTYSPQQVLSDDQSITLEEGQNFSISAITNSPDNTYTWIKDGVTLSNETLQTFNISETALDDTGAYHAEIDNSVVTGLVLSTGTTNLTVSEVLGLIDMGLLEPINVYPNPAKNRIIISPDKSLSPQAELKFYKLDGKLIEVKSLKYSLDISKIEIDISSFSKGIYLMILKDADKLFYHKLIKE